MKLKCRVWLNKSNGQKAVTIPYNSNIEQGEYVWVEKIDDAIKRPKSKKDVDR